MANNSSPRLEIEVSVKGISDATKEFSALHKQLEDTDKEFRKANATVNDLEGELKSLSNSLNKGTISQSRYDKEVKDVSNALASARQAAQGYQARIQSLNATINQGTNAGRQYGNAVNTLQGVHDSVSKGIRGSTSVSIEFSRVLQDLPYGIQGVANNFQQLSTNLGYYINNVKESLLQQGKQATTMNVTKALLGGLVSPMGLVTLGVSALTAGWVLFEKWQQKSNKETSKTTDRISELVSQLNNLASANYKAIQSYGTEIAKLSTLYNVSTDVNASMEARVNAIKTIKSEYPNYFGNLTNEAILAGEAKKQYDELTKSIISAAKARAAEGLIAEKWSKQFALDATNKDLERQKKAFEDNAKAAREFLSVQGGTTGFSPVSTGNITGDVTAGGAVLKVNKQITENLLERAKLQEDINELSKVAIDNQSQLTVGTENTNKKVKNTSSLINEINSLTSGIIRDSLNSYDAKLFDISKKYDEIKSKITDTNVLGIAKINEEFERLNVSVERFIDNLSKTRLNRNGISLSGALTIPTSLTAKNPFNPKQVDFGDEFTKQFQSTLRRGLASTFDNFFSNIGDLTSKNFEIEKKYQEMRSNATASQIDGLNKMESLEKRINSGLSNMLSNIASTFTNIGGNMLSSALSSGISSGNFTDLRNMFSGKNKAVGYGALGSMAGSLLQGVTSKSSGLGQGLGGALAGAGTGAALGSIVPGIGTAIGAIGGAIIGGISGLIGAGKKQKEEELLELQLQEQKKLVALQERQAALAYTSSIVGQMTNQGIVTALDRDAFGNLVTKINGKDIEIVLQRTQNGRG